MWVLPILDIGSLIRQHLSSAPPCSKSICTLLWCGISRPCVIILLNLRQLDPTSIHMPGNNIATCLLVTCRRWQYGPSSLANKKQLSMIGTTIRRWTGTNADSNTMRIPLNRPHDIAPIIFCADSSRGRSTVKYFTIPIQKPILKMVSFKFITSKYSVSLSSFKISIIKTELVYILYSSTHRQA